MGHDVWGGAGGAGGIVVRPGGQELRPAVLLTPAISGINSYVIHQAQRLASAGYVCLALDYHGRRGSAPDLSSPAKIMSAVASLADPEVLDDMTEAAQWLRDQSFTDGHVSALGFCIGGTYALLAAASIPDLRCAIAFYGTLRYPKTSASKPCSPLGRAADIRCPVLGHFGDSDHLIPLADVQDLREQLRGKPAEVYTYPGAGHAFHEDFRPGVYRPVAAVTAWARSQEYLSFYSGAGARP